MIHFVADDVVVVEFSGCCLAREAHKHVRMLLESRSSCLPSRYFVSCFDFEVACSLVVYYLCVSENHDVDLVLVGLPPPSFPFHPCHARGVQATCSPCGRWHRPPCLRPQLATVVAVHMINFPHRKSKIRGIVFTPCVGCVGDALVRFSVDRGDAADAGGDHQPAEAQRQAAQHASLPIPARYRVGSNETGERNQLTPFGVVERSPTNNNSTR